MITIKPENIRTGSIKNLYHDVSMDVLRLDLINPVISGNKWFKLKYYIQKALEEKKKGILTFGGAYSNHIVATAEACRMEGLLSAAVIRGEKPAGPSSTLKYAAQAGMQLYYTSREEYRRKDLPSEIQNTGDWLVVEEGGYGIAGAEGAATILNYTSEKYDHIITAVGTGTTLAGICLAETGANCIGISVMKNNYALDGEVNKLLPASLQNGFQIDHRFHFGGYAKRTDELIRFMNDWYGKTHIPTDFVYTAKMFFAVDTMIRSGYFSKGARILTLHTGGLQGNNSLPNGTLIFDSFSL